MPQKKKEVVQEKVEKQVKHRELVGFGNPGLKRLCRRAGVERVSGLVHFAVREWLKRYHKKVLRDANICVQYADRRTIKKSDVLYAIRKRLGRPLYMCA